MTSPRYGWVAWVGSALVTLGLGLSVYLTVAHYTTPVVLACPETGVINCSKVTTSSYATIMGMPLAVLGLLYFVTILPLQLPMAWRSQNIWLRRIRLAASGIGVVMIFWLIYVELFMLNAICLYCTAVHVVTLSLFVLTAVGTALTRTQVE
jgi:uncharacterized membrane protein